MPTADRTQAITDSPSCTLPAPRDPETQPGARTTGDTNALPTSPASPRQGKPTEKAGAGPQERAVGDSREGPDSPCGEQLAVMDAEKATVLPTHLALHALPASPPGTDRHHPPTGGPRLENRTVNWL